MKMLLHQEANAHVTREHVHNFNCPFDFFVLTFASSLLHINSFCRLVIAADEAFRLPRVSFCVGYFSFSVSNITF